MIIQQLDKFQKLPPRVFGYFYHIESTPPKIDDNIVPNGI